MRFYYLLFIVALGCGCGQKNNHHKNTDAVVAPMGDSTVATVTSIPGDTICIAATGDIMLGTSYPDSSALPPHGGIHSFDAVKTELQQADIAFGNLEGVLLDSGAAADFKLKQRSKAHFFRMPESYAGILKDAGYDVISMANNHVSDFGLRGRKSTIKALDAAGIYHAGLLSHPSTIFTINNVTYGFCAFAPNSNTMPFLDLKNTARIITELKEQADVVIVSFHGGGEGTKYEHVPFAAESFKGENRGNVHAFAHNAIDAGADLVLGHGPHLTRAIELYQNRLIAYSLGNFCTYKGVSVSGICGIAPLLKIYINKKGAFLYGKIIPTRQTHYKGLERDTLNTVIKRLQVLTTADFPQSGLNIANDGSITKAD